MACSCKKNKRAVSVKDIFPPPPTPEVTAINGAIKDLQAAKRFLSQKRFERAENAIANSLPDIAKAIRGINRAERKLSKR
ncbi:hypothetical protein [Paenibacillus guangzhouensis]|uniref:hypothetical protein n=1 Tax=Paenibacillus guangzhouensis TaxID=1473112 RepID=UPI0012669253|nr:hypothetical protein [Paenibacillus guangzhouensis]